MPNKACERSKYPQNSNDVVFGRRLLVPLILVVLLADTSFMIGAEPAITISSPEDGARLLTHQANVTGTASGTPQTWNQTSQRDFENGTMENLTTNEDGDLFLDGGLYDDFSENYLDPERWYIANETEGMSTSVNDSALFFSGICNTSVIGESQCIINSTHTFNNSISARCLWWDGVCSYQDGTGFYTGVGIADHYLYPSSYFEIGIECFPEYGIQIPAININYQSGNAGGDVFPSSHSHNPVTLGISWNSTNCTLFVDGDLIYDQPLYSWQPLVNPHMYFKSWAENKGASVSSSWDDVTGDPVHSGSFVSGVHDAGYSMPMLKNVDWNATTPADTLLSVAIRSSDNPDMSDANDWAPVTNSTIAGLPAIKRYIQYRADFTSEDGIHSPVLHDITLSYDAKPVAKVEVSIDDKSTWREANGTHDWYINLDLPEGPNTIWVRATHPAGDFDLESISVDVDTTPPTGAIVINDNDTYVNEREVILTFNASDRYNVSWMMLSEDPSFKGTAWQEYGWLAYFVLSEGDGPKTIYAKFKDTSGWESAVVNNSIVLDTTPPTASILPLPSVVYTVCWTGSDLLSGLFSINVQYKDNDGNWTYWQILTNSTSAVFSGIDGHDYSFRIEAMDKATNVHPYPVTGTGPVRVRLPKPVVNILSPGENSSVKSAIYVEGNATHQNASLKITEVQVRIDDGRWQSAAGTTAWKWKWNLARTRMGAHTIRARAFDGQYYSAEAVVNVTVKNPGDKASVEANAWPVLAAIIILAVVASGIYLSLKSRRKPS
jgi:hypothetical protein